MQSPRSIFKICTSNTCRCVHTPHTHSHSHIDSTYMYMYLHLYCNYFVRNVRIKIQLYKIHMNMIHTCIHAGCLSTNMHYIVHSFLTHRFIHVHVLAITHSYLGSSHKPVSLCTICDSTDHLYSSLCTHHYQGSLHLVQNSH